MNKKEILEALKRANERINRLEDILCNLATRQGYTREITKPELKRELEERKILNSNKAFK